MSVADAAEARRTTPDVVSLQAHGNVEVVMAGLAQARDTFALASILSEAERTRARRFLFDRDRRRFIVARARLRQLLSARLETAPEAIELECGPRGKPRLASGCAARDLRFNLSRCGDLAVFAFTSGLEVGIDVEAVRLLPDAGHVAARCFSAHELAAYLALEPAEKPLGFFNCWTRKEAFVKAIGDGLHYPLDRFDVSLAPGAPAQLLRVDGIPGERCGWRLAAFCPLPGHVAAVVTEVRAGRFP